MEPVAVFLDVCRLARKQTHRNLTVLDIDRFRGCLLGLAAGDALGTTLEFNLPGTFF